MTTKSTESNPPAPSGETYPHSQAGLPEHQCYHATGNVVFKSGPLFISSKGIGWTSWKKRWFILTRTSLVFFRSDPTAIPQKSGEANLTLGGIDLNNSGRVLISVEVKPDKKLLTVLFPDGRDGRAFTLKAETLEDIHEWKAALESALMQAPSATLVMGQNGILKSDQADAVNGPSDQQKDRVPVKSMVIGRPILLALEEIDGSPSFLEKALRFIEDHGVRVEGVLRQAADVEEVERRVREHEQGKTEFLPGEDAHVVADCVKHVLRELPSSPVPASCCNALLEAFRTDRSDRFNTMRIAILETFPEPNRRLLQRILRMMQIVVLHKAENRMSTSAVAACMAPLLLCPLLAGDCEVENHHFDVAGDGSFQLLQAAAAANHAQAIIITLLDEYEHIFGAGTISPELFSDSEDSGSESEEATDDEEIYDDDDDEYGTEEHEKDDEDERSLSGTRSGGDDDDDGDSYDDKHSERSSLVSRSPERDDHYEAVQRSSSASSNASTPRHIKMQGAEDVNKQDNNSAAGRAESSGGSNRDIPAETSMGQKNPSMESIDFSLDEEEEIKKLEAAKNDLQNRIAEEANGNAILQTHLEKRKKALHERRLALEKDVARLQEQLRKERDLRASLEAGLGKCQGPVSASIHERTKNELQEIALAEDDSSGLKQRFKYLEVQLSDQHEQSYSRENDRSSQEQAASSQWAILVDRQKENETSRMDKQENETSRMDKLKENETSKINKQKDNDSSRIDKRKDNEAGKMNEQKDNATSKMNKQKDNETKMGKQNDNETKIGKQNDNETNKIDKQKDNETSKISKLKDNETSRITKQKDNDSKATAYQHERSTRSKEQPNHKSDGVDDNERRHELPSTSNKNQNQQVENACGGGSRFGGVLNNLAALDVTKPSFAASAKKNSKGEGSNTASALSKLTTQLNFLKERKNQIANELQNWDETRESTQSPRNPDKGKGLETNQSIQIPNHGQESRIRRQHIPEPKS